MVQRPAASFALESFERPGLRPDFREEEFQGDKASQRNVFRFVNNAHASAGQLFKDSVVRVRPPNHREMDFRAQMGKGKSTSMGSMRGSSQVKSF